MSDPEVAAISRLHALIDDRPRPWEMSGRDAYLLIDALEVLKSEWQKAASETPEDVASDKATIEHMDEIAVRLWEFVGFSKPPRSLRKIDDDSS